jgi:hypothetical protein
LNRLHAYVLAADPTWLEASVLAYYPHVQKIVVSYDRGGRGWTGAPIPVQECLDRLRSIDGDRKMEFVPGCFSELVGDPMQNDTFQRNTALSQASIGADWVLQLDTDEWLPHPVPFLHAISRADELALDGIEWPMRVLYRTLGGGRVLEICSGDGLDHFEYIAPVAVRAGTRLVHSRRIAGGFLRAVARGDMQSTQLHRPPLTEERREVLLEPTSAVIHNSWARSPAQLRNKLSSWSHAGMRAWVYYAARWLPSVWLWRWMKNLHPYFGGIWPALRVCQQVIPECDLGSGAIGAIERDWNGMEGPAKHLPGSIV